MPPAPLLAPRAQRPSERSGSDASDEGTPSFGGESLEEGLQPVGEELEEALPGQLQEGDKLLHWWCQKNLPHYLKRLVKCPQAAPFREPLPWRELGLTDYLEVVQRPMDLKTIGTTLDNGGYEDAEGFLNPDFFWEDVALCWDNCMQYYEEDEEVEAFQLAEDMAAFSAELEEEFWSELNYFEASMKQLDPTLRSVAAMTDVAARTVEDAAAAAYEDGSKVAKEVIDRIAKWWWGAGQKAKTPERPPLEITLEARKPLRDHYQELLMLQLNFDALEDINYIEGLVLDGLDSSWPSFEAAGREEEPEEDEGLAFEGAERKLPIAQLVPAQALALKRWSTLRSRMGPSACQSVSSQRSNGSSRNSRTASPACSEHSGGLGAGAWRPPTPPGAGGRRTGASSARTSRSNSSRGRAAAPSSAAAVVSLLPESASESDRNASAPDVQSLRRIMPRRGASRTPPPK